MEKSKTETWILAQSQTIMEYNDLTQDVNQNLDIEWDPTRQDEIKLLTENTEETIRFIETEMTADDLRTNLQEA